MKHTRALSTEPPLLAQYRQTYPNEEQRPADEAGATWDGFKTDQAAYRQVLDELARVQQGLCIYCEQRLVDLSGQRVANDYQVEHIQAKSGAVGRVLDWKNLALACAGGTYTHHQDVSRKFSDAQNTSCGQTKGDQDLPTGCDPRGLPIVGALTGVGLDGKLIVIAKNCAAVGVSTVDLDAAIKLLNLNCERLRKARQDIGDNVRSWFVFMLEELISSQLRLDQQQLQVDLLVARRLQPDGHGYLPRFWTAERSALGAPAETWLATNQAQFT
jgi:uncharacterized protein (TIGR02646 family)